jgi:hypothetical protein
LCRRAISTLFCSTVVIGTPELRGKRVSNGCCRTREGRERTSVPQRAICTECHTEHRLRKEKRGRTERRGQKEKVRSAVAPLLSSLERLNRPYDATLCDRKGRATEAHLHFPLSALWGGGEVSTNRRGREGERGRTFWQETCRTLRSRARTAGSFLLSGIVEG